MKSFKSFLTEQDIFEDLLFEEFLTEAKDDPTKEGGASNNTKGVLHELLVGHHMQGGKHMENHHLINEQGKRESPKEAHDRLKSQIHPKDYEKINAKAKSAAKDLHALIKKRHPGFEVSHVHHTSKAGDTEKETGVKASQSGPDSDSSDNYITVKHPKTGEVRKIGASLKVSDNASKNVPSSSLGMESSGSKAKELYKEHQKKVHKLAPGLKDVKKEEHHKDIKDARKEWATKNPELHNKIKSHNKKLLADVAHHHAAELQTSLNNGNHEHVIEHIRNVLAARKTPAEKAGKAHFIKHTTYVTKSGIQHHTANPGEDHEHILKDHKNIKVKAAGGSVHFYHTDPKTGEEKKFASQAHKFDSQSDPLSSLKSAGKAV